MVQCNFNTVRERDMDLLFLEAFVTDSGFSKMIVDRTKFCENPFVVVRAELSRTELNLGESDITISIEISGERYGLLIEDKIDAIAMPKQHRRYHERGLKGIKDAEYCDYDVLIFCPKKYYQQNAEAKLYECFVSYEECKEYFDAKNDLISQLRSQRVSQAISKAKKPPEVTLNEVANAFFNKYKEYQKNNYSVLDLRTSEKSNGWWICYGTCLGNVIIYHKTQEGYADLTFPNASSKMDVISNLVYWLRMHGTSNAIAVTTGNAGTIRLEIPKLKVTSDFENTSEEDIKSCFEAIQVLTDFANMVDSAKQISVLKKQ